MCRPRCRLGGPRGRRDPHGGPPSGGRRREDRRQDRPRPEEGRGQLRGGGPSDGPRPAVGTTRPSPDGGSHDPGGALAVPRPRGRGLQGHLREDEAGAPRPLYHGPLRLGGPMSSEVATEIRTTHILDLAASGKRLDGRGPDEYRNVVLEPGFVETAD